MTGVPSGPSRMRTAFSAMGLSSYSAMSVIVARNVGKKEPLPRLRWGGVPGSARGHHERDEDADEVDLHESGDDPRPRVAQTVDHGLPPGEEGVSELSEPDGHQRFR